MPRPRLHPHRPHLAPYVDLTNDLVRRVCEHKSKLIEGFTEETDVVKLVYFEQFDDPENATGARNG